MTDSAAVREQTRLRMRRLRDGNSEKYRQQRRDSARRMRDPVYRAESLRRREEKRLQRAADPVKYLREYSRAHQRKRRNFPVPTRPCPDGCELCGGPPRGKCSEGALALDHDHETGAFRGWLCHPCNSALGRLGDTLASLERACAYLRGDHIQRC